MFGLFKKKDKPETLVKELDIYAVADGELINIENVNKVTELNKTPILMFNLMVHPFEIEQLTKELLQFK